MADHIPRSPRRRARSRRRLLVLGLLAATAACGGERGVQGFLARKAVLERQVEDLGRLVRAAEQGGLLPKDKLVVAVSEAMANGLVRLALPREQLIGGRYRVRLEQAEVRFRDEHGSVRFDGRAGPAEGAEPAFLAELALFGVVDTVDVDRETGVLRCNVSFVGFELKRFDAYGDSETGRLLLEELGRQGLDALRALAFPIAIPVRLEQEIALSRVAREGPVRLRPASLPLRLAVTDVAAHGGRLWVAVEVTVGPKTKAAGPPSPSRPLGAEGARP